MAGTPIHPHVHNTLVFADASKKGWGAHLNDNVKPLVKQRISTSHQYAGAKSCSVSLKGLSVSLTRSKGSDLFRQQYSIVPTEQRRRHSVEIN